MRRRANGERIAPDGSQDEGALSQVRDPEDVQYVFLLGCEPCLHLRRKEKSVDAKSNLDLLAFINETVLPFPENSQATSSH